MVSKKILVVSDVIFPWSIGGAEERYQNIASGYPMGDYELHFATVRWVSGETPPNYFFISKKSSIYNNNKKRSIFSSIAFSMATLKILKLKFDVIEANQIPIIHLFPLWLVSRIKRVPFTVTWHEVWSKEDWEKYSPRYAIFAHALSRMAAHLPDKIISVSEFSKRKLIAQGIEEVQVTVIEHQINMHEIEVSQTQLNGTDFLYVGRLIHHKRVDLLLEAFATVLVSYPYVTLGIVGEGPEYENLVKLAQMAKISHAVTFFGKLQDKRDVFALIKKSKAFVTASEREGYGIAVAEAIAAGIRVIVSSASENAAQYLVRDGTDYIFDSGNSENLSMKMVEIIRNPMQKAIIDQELKSVSISNQYFSIWKSLVEDA